LENLRRFWSRFTQLHWNCVWFWSSPGLYSPGTI